MVKNTRLFIPIAILIIIIGLIITLGVFKSLFKSTITSSSTPGLSANSGAVSDNLIYFQGPISATASGQKTVTNPKANQGLSIYWIKATGTDSNYTCTLYDSVTSQIYASHYQTNGEFSGRGAGSMYYTNNVIKQDKSLSLLSSVCFKD